MKADMTHLPIGVFDSGVGGLSVLHVLQEMFPAEDFIYIGDNKNNPVGNRPPEEITAIACRIAQFLEAVPVKMLVVACNTFTVVALDTIRHIVHIPVIGVSQGMASAIQATDKHTIGIMATVATVNSHIHKHVALEMDHELFVWEQPCPLLAGLIEQGHVDDEPVKDVLTTYLKPIQNRDIDVVVLGCTHFPFIKETAEALTEGTITFIDPAYETAEWVRRTMMRSQLARTDQTVGKSTLYFTSDTALAHKLCEQHATSRPVTIDTITL